MILFQILIVTFIVIASKIGFVSYQSYSINRARGNSTKLSFSAQKKICAKLLLYLSVVVFWRSMSLV